MTARSSDRSTPDLLAGLARVGGFADRFAAQAYDAMNIAATAMNIIIGVIW